MHQGRICSMSAREVQPLQCVHSFSCKKSLALANRLLQNFEQFFSVFLVLIMIHEICHKPINQTILRFDGILAPFSQRFILSFSVQPHQGSKKHLYRLIKLCTLSFNHIFTNFLQLFYKNALGVLGFSFFHFLEQNFKFFLVRAECDVAFICRTYVKHNVDPENATRDGKFFTKLFQGLLV